MVQWHLLQQESERRAAANDEANDERGVGEEEEQEVDRSQHVSVREPAKATGETVDIIYHNLYGS